MKGHAKVVADQKRVTPLLSNDEALHMPSMQGGIPHGLALSLVGVIIMTRNQEFPFRCRNYHTSKPSILESTQSSTVRPSSTMRFLLLVLVSPSLAWVTPQQLTRYNRQFSSLYAAPRRNLTAAERARREEEERRRERANDVVIGKTSALPSAEDYQLDPTTTEQEYLRQASKVEQQVFLATAKGLDLLKMLRVEEAIDEFNTVFQLRPSAYLWQAGIAKFYAGDLEGAAEIFAKNAELFEAKFGSPATEERIWRHACELKLWHSMSRADRHLVAKTGGVESLLTPIPEKEHTQELLRSETRKAIRITRDLFSASVEEDHSSLILARARLRSIVGEIDSTTPRLDRKLWKLTASYFLGLHYDAVGDEEESKKCMKMALRLCPSSGNGSDIIHTLPLLHMSRRDWFDDEEFEEFEVGQSLTTTTTASKSASPIHVDADPILAESIRSSLESLRYIDLQKALKLRGIKSTGPKEDLQERLFLSLMKDAGLTQ